MTPETRLEKLERAKRAKEALQKANLDAWLDSLPDGDLECVCRDTARSIRCGELQGDDLVEFYKLSDTPDPETWLESVEPPQPGDAEKLARLMAAAPEPYKKTTG